MSKRFIQISSVLFILCLFVNISLAQMDEEDFDDLFEDTPDIEPEVFDQIEIEDIDVPITEPDVEVTEEKIDIPVPQYIPEEPVPEFDSAYDKYMYYARKYLVELCISSILIIYVLNIFVGKKVNSKIVSMWVAEAIPVLKKNFHHTGFGEEPNYSISQLKYHEYEFFASGRDYCHYLFLHMITKKRQDVIGGSLFELIWPDKDKVIFDIPIDVDIPLEILVCRQGDVKKTQSEMPNINQLIAPVPSKSFANTNLAVLADSTESVDIVFPRRFSDAFKKYEKYLEFLHVTDQRVYTNYPLVLKAEILMGDNPKEFANSVALLEILIDLVDHIAKPLKLPSRVLEKAKKLREAEEKKREKVS